MFKSRWWLGLVIMGLCLAILIPASAADTRPRIAVLDFNDGSIKDHWWGNDWDVGKGISDIIYQGLYETGRFRLFERQQIDAILKEQNLGTGGRVAISSAPKLGEVMGVQYILFGDVTEFTISKQGVVISIIAVSKSTASVKVNGRLVDTTTGEIVALAKGGGKATESKAGIWTGIGLIAFGGSDFEKTILGQATRQAVDQFAANLSAEADKVGLASGAPTAPTALTGQVAAYHAAKNKVSLNIGSRDGVTNGMIFTITHIEGQVLDPDTGEVIGYDNKWDVCEIIISDVQEKMSSGIITNRFTNDDPQIKDVAAQKL